MKKNLTIKILIGIPASGKSTWVKKFLLKNPSWVRVNRDSFRLMLRNENSCEPKIEDAITNMMNHAIHSALSKKLNVIIDNTNVKEKYIQNFIDEFSYRANIEYQVFDISKEKAIERDNNRKDKVGEKVIERMYDDYKILMDTFHFQPQKRTITRPYIIPDFNSELDDCVIFDIDGTIALMNHRTAFDWHLVHRDNPNKIVIEHINFHKNLGRKIILLSGRDSASRRLTEDWLDMYNIEYDELYMRKENDYRKDTIIKKELYENHIKNRYNVLAIYDDRLQVLDMWNKEGLFTFNVNQGNLEF